MFTLQVTLDDDPVQVAEWVRAYEEHYFAAKSADAHADQAASPAATSPDEEELAAEVERFRSNSRAYGARFMRLHEGLLALGCVPVLSKKQKPTSVRTYIAYALPNGRRVLENNSSTAYFVGTEFVDRLRGTHEWLKPSGQLLSVQFDTEDKVDLVLQIAEAEMEK
ncbi:MAG TPA: hypothetical protein VGJ14_08765 [Sporichthyaceae bacterium]